MKPHVIVLMMLAVLACAIPLAAQTIDPGTGIVLTNTKSYFPVWSPDGQWIAGCGGFDGVWIVSSNGGTAAKLVGKPSVKYNGKTIGFMLTCKISFTPDSREILYTSYLIDEARGTKVTISTDGASTSVSKEIPVLMAVDIQTQATRVIREEAEYGVYSKSGRYFGYVNYDHRAVTDPANAAHHYSLALYDTQTKETNYLTDGLGARTQAFSFNNDETRIAAAVIDTKYSTPVYSIYIVPIDGGKPVDITWRDNPLKLFSFSNPVWSPDGRWILYTAISDTRRMLFAYDVTNGKTAAVFPDTPVWNTDAAWSPDGKKFCCQLEVSATHNGGLYSFDFTEAGLGLQPQIQEVPQYIPREFGARLVNVDMSAISTADTRYYNAMWTISKRQFIPFWSPDGSSVYWGMISGQEDNGIWKVSAAGGLPEQIKSFFLAYPYKDYMITEEQPIVQGFAPGGSEIVYSSFLIDESRGTVVTITPGTGPYGQKYSGCGISNPVTVTRVLDLKTGDTRIVMDNAAYGCYSPSRRFFAYSTGSTERIVALADLTTGESRTIYSTYGKPVAFDPAESCVYLETSSGCMRVPLGGGEPEKIIASSCYSLNMSSDGRFLLFAGSHSGVKGLFVYDITTKLVTSVINEKLGYSISGGSFSPDGKKMCYLLNSNDEGDWQHIYVKDFNTGELGIPSDVAETAPAAFALTGNRPNPFNPSTSIGFSIDRPGAVRLAVYSLSGQKVRELVSGAVMRSGTHSVIWDGRDTNGRAVSSGVYIARLVHDGRAVSRKMMLMK